MNRFGLILCLSVMLCLTPGIIFSLIDSRKPVMEREITDGLREADPRQYDKVGKKFLL